ncbi:MAG: hypothetical protein QXY40_00645 [Candidatus Methanomethylicia archaeon]
MFLVDTLRKIRIDLYLYVHNENIEVKILIEIDDVERLTGNVKYRENNR